MAQFVISDEQEMEISALCRIAEHNGSALTLGEVLEATSMVATENDLATAWATSPLLNASYELEAGWIFERGRRGTDLSYSAAAETVRERTSASNIRQAADFSTVCVDRRVRLLAVSGGNSYRRAGPGDDVDFFSVTMNDSLWIFMLRSLILSRIYSVGRRRGAPFCFSYVVEERKALRDFRGGGDRLFARDALMAHVLYGSGFYQSLLSEAGWMERYFPKLYSRVKSSRVPSSGPAPGAGNIVLNSFLYYTLGTYVKIKAFLLSARLRRKGRAPAEFHADIGKDRCVYESNRYRRLRSMYRKMGEGPE